MERIRPDSDSIRTLHENLELEPSSSEEHGRCTRSFHRPCTLDTDRVIFLPCTNFDGIFTEFQNRTRSVYTVGVHGHFTDRVPSFHRPCSLAIFDG